MYFNAQVTNVSMFGPVVCPPLRIRRARSPSTKTCPTSGLSVAPGAFLPSSFQRVPYSPRAGVRPVANESGAWDEQGDQFVGVHRQIARGLRDCVPRNVPAIQW